MCDEADGMCAIWDEKDLRCAKAKLCTGCRETIRVGDQYRRTATLFDGSWSNYVHCMRCASIVAALKQRDYASVTQDTLYLNCGEIWDDPPEALAELAFALPGELTCVAEIASEAR